MDVNYPYGLYSGDLLANRVSTLESEMGSIAPTGLNNPLLKPCSPRVAMHRGFNTQAPENTIPAFELAGQAGAWAIETDIYETTDGYFVISHDNDVSRMTDGTGKITEMTYSQTQECTIDAGANVEQYPNLKMPTLQEYLSICRRYGCVAFVEIKGITHYDALVDAIRKAGMEGSVVFLCYYSLSEVNTIRTYTGAPIALLGSVNSDLTALTDHAAENVDVWIDIYSTTVATEVLMHTPKMFQLRDGPTALRLAQIPHFVEDLILLLLKDLQNSPLHNTLIKLYYILFTSVINKVKYSFLYFLK